MPVIYISPYYSMLDYSLALEGVYGFRHFDRYGGSQVDAAVTRVYDPGIIYFGTIATNSANTTNDGRGYGGAEAEYTGFTAYAPVPSVVLGEGIQVINLDATLWTDTLSYISTAPTYLPDQNTVKNIAIPSPALEAALLNNGTLTNTGNNGNSVISTWSTTGATPGGIYYWEIWSNCPDRHIGITERNYSPGSGGYTSTADPTYVGTDPTGFGTYVYSFVLDSSANTLTVYSNGSYKVQLATRAGATYYPCTAITGQSMTSSVFRFAAASWTRYADIVALGAISPRIESLYDGTAYGFTKNQTYYLSDTTGYTRTYEPAGVPIGIAKEADSKMGYYLYDSSLARATLSPGWVEGNQLYSSEPVYPFKYTQDVALDGIYMPYREYLSTTEGYYTDQFAANYGAPLNTGVPYTLLMHFEGSVTAVNGNTISSLSGSTVGTAKFGTGGFPLNGSSRFIANTGYFGTQDLTIDFWYNNVAVSNNGQAIVQIADNYTVDYSSGGVMSLAWMSNQLNIVLNGEGWTTNVSWTNNTWYHIAITRSGSLWKLFVNGTQASTYSSATSGNAMNGSNVVVGYNKGYNYGNNATIDELCVTVGLNRYPANFTAPTVPHNGSKFVPTSANIPVAKDAYLIHKYYDRINGDTAIATPTIFVDNNQALAYGIISHKSMDKSKIEDEADLTNIIQLYYPTVSTAVAPLKTGNQLDNTLLQNGTLVVSTPSAWKSQFNSTSPSTGMVYYEILATTASSLIFGFTTGNGYPANGSDLGSTYGTGAADSQWINQIDEPASNAASVYDFCWYVNTDYSVYQGYVYGALLDIANRTLKFFVNGVLTRSFINLPTGRSWKACASVHTMTGTFRFNHTAWTQASASGASLAEYSPGGAVSGYATQACNSSQRVIAEVEADSTQNYRDYLENGHPSPTLTYTGDPAIAVLLNFENNITDTIGNATWTNITYSTSYKTFGTYCGRFSGDRTATVQLPTPLGTQDFTMECWFTSDNVSSSWNSPLGMGTNAYYEAGGLYLCLRGNNTYLYVSGTLYSGTNLTFSNNTTYHIAIVRLGTSWNVYIDGVSRLAFTSSSSITQQQVYLGYNTGYGYFTGYMDEFCLTRRAKYSTNFMVPTAAFDASVPIVVSLDTPQASSVYLYPLQEETSTTQNKTRDYLENGHRSPVLTTTSTDPYNSNTIALLHMAGGISDVFGSSIVNSNVTYNTTTKKYGAGSAYFAANGYLQVLTSASSGLGDFTLECWYYGVNVQSAWHTVLGFGNTSGPAGTLYLTVYQNNTQLTVNGSGLNSTTSYTWSNNTWYHVALVRAGSTISVYRDGVLVLTGTSSQAFTYAPTIGYYNAYGYLNGYIDEFRVSNTARYTANFTPPAAEFDNTVYVVAEDTTPVSIESLRYQQVDETKATQIQIRDFIPNGYRTPTGTWTSSDPAGSTVAIFPFDGTLAGSTGNNLIISGTESYSTATKKFGQSLYVNGGTYAYNDAVLPGTFGNSDLTIECWANYSSTYCIPFGIGSRNSYSHVGMSLAINGGTYYFYVNGTHYGLNGTTVTRNTWHHIAVTRRNHVWEIWLNGNLTSANLASAGAFSINNATIGGIGYNTGYGNMTGYIDDLRVTKGVARYTANFTPPTQAFVAATFTATEDITPIAISPLVDPDIDTRITGLLQGASGAVTNGNIYDVGSIQGIVGDYWSNLTLTTNASKTGTITPHIHNDTTHLITEDVARTYNAVVGTQFKDSFEQVAAVDTNNWLVYWDYDYETTLYPLNTIEAKGLSNTVAFSSV